MSRTTTTADIFLESKKLLWGILIFLGFFVLPLGWPRFDQSIFEALYLAREYAQAHVLLCLLPAFFIAGGIAVFISRDAVMTYLGPKAHKAVAYTVASVSGTILAVCSCTVLPLFAGIWRKGAGLGPAVAFLYSGPAINVLAIVMTSAVLGPSLGIARAIGAVSFSVIIGMAMHFIFRKSELERNADIKQFDDSPQRPLHQTVLQFLALVGILVFANWGKSSEPEGLWHAIYIGKWLITTGFGVMLAFVLTKWFGLKLWKTLSIATATAVMWAVTRWGILPNWGGDLPGVEEGVPYGALIPFVTAIIGLTIAMSVGNRPKEALDWMDHTWNFTKQIMPLLLIGVLVAGFLLGRPGHEGMIPSEWVSSLVGDNSFSSNFFASIIGAFMYFATLTEVPILQGLMGSGMNKGPALALLLAGPALSLPNMLVIRSVMGT
ncbi:MAG: permease, partial [Kiritimatiellia bacterium]